MPYAPAIKVTGGSMIFCAGVTAAPVYHHHPHIAEEFDAMPDNMEGQARAALEQLKKGLEAAGSSFEDVISADRFLTDMEEQDDLNKVWAEYFGDAKTRHNDGSGGPPGDRSGCKIEINAIAVVD